MHHFYLHIDYFDHFDQYIFMARTVTATEAKVRFGEVLNDVAVAKNHVEIERQGKKIAVMLPKEDYDDLLRLREFEKPFSRRDAFRSLLEWRDSLPKPDPDAPSAVEILRELRNRDRFS